MCRCKAQQPLESERHLAEHLHNCHFDILSPCSGVCRYVAVMHCLSVPHVVYIFAHTHSHITLIYLFFFSLWHERVASASNDGFIAPVTLCAVLLRCMLNLFSIN